MSRSCSIVSSVFLMSLVAAVFAQERFDYRVRGDFFAGLSGDEAALARAMETTERILEDDPEHAEARVWHGAGTFFRSSQAFDRGDVRSGQTLWDEGLAEMAKAVSLEPDNVGVVVLRGSVLLQASLSTPPALTRDLVRTGVGDFERIRELQGADFHSLGTHPRGELLQGLAGGWARLGDTDRARHYYDRIVQELPGSEYARRAATWLDTGRLPNDRMRCYGCHVEQ